MNKFTDAELQFIAALLGHHTLNVKLAESSYNKIADYMRKVGIPESGPLRLESIKSKMYGERLMIRETQS